jgi:mono/diheme cytochrome c family protein
MTNENRLGIVLSAIAALGLSACSSKPKFDHDLQLGGKTVSAATLEKGRENYTLYCRSCHGDEGKGNGASSFGLRPAPRDFTQAQFKFGWVIDGLPHDDDLERIVKSGLHGTAMLPWQILDRELQPTLQYIKTFNVEEWRDGQLGTKVVPTPDPWGAARKSEAIERGRTVYHGIAQCGSCHPSYATKDFIFQARGGKADFRENMYYSERKASHYVHEGKELSILPPDFTWSELRSIRKGTELEDLYRLIGAGIPGTAMPSWKDALPEEDLWSLAYYVRSLTELRDTPQATALRQQLFDQPQFLPPATPAPPATQPASTSGM